MTRIRFISAHVKTFPDERPDACKHCGSQILTQRGAVEKSVTDLYEEKVTVVRCRRSDCGSAFRHCPEGVDRGGQNPADARMGCARVGARPVAALREPSAAAFGVSLSRMSARRDVQEAGRNARHKQAGRAGGQVRLIGADETAVRVKGVKKVVGVVADAETGQVLGLDVLVERDADGFMEWLGDFVSDCGVEAMVTDDLNTYKPVVERLGIDHQICIAHARKRAWNRLDGIDGWDWIKARIWRLLTELPFDGDLDLPRLERAVRDGDATLRRMRVDLSGKWRALLRHLRRRDVPWTSNAAERAIGGSKIRYKTVRGYKSEDWMLNGFGLRRWAWSGLDGLELSDLVAA